VERHVVAEEVFRLAAEPGTPVRAVHGFGGGVAAMDDPENSSGRSVVRDAAHGRVEHEAGILAESPSGPRSRRVQGGMPRRA
jgi:hypothetical protein